MKDLDKDLITETNQARFQIVITTSSSVRKNQVEIGVTIQGLLLPGTPLITLTQTTG